MEIIKNGLINNRFLLINLNSCELFANLFIIFLSFMFLRGEQLWLTILVATIHSCISIHVLKWSIKYRIYQSDKLIRFKFSRNLVSGFVFFAFYCVKTIFQSVILITMFSLWVTGTLTNDIEGVQMTEWMRAFFLFSFILAVIGYVFLTYSKVDLITSNSYEKEMEGIVKMFKLNINETTFCSSGFDLTGFISAGFIQTTEGIYYKDVLFKNIGHVVHYLHNADINLNELDDSHLQIIKMCNI